MEKLELVEGRGEDERVCVNNLLSVSRNASGEEIEHTG